MDIDLSVLRLMERERDIPFDELVQIIEQAIHTAYLKHVARPTRSPPATSPTEPAVVHPHPASCSTARPAT